MSCMPLHADELIWFGILINVRVVKLKLAPTFIFGIFTFIYLYIELNEKSEQSNSMAVYVYAQYIIY